MEALLWVYAWVLLNPRVGCPRVIPILHNPQTIPLTTPQQPQIITAFYPPWVGSPGGSMGGIPQGGSPEVPQTFWVGYVLILV